MLWFVAVAGGGGGGKGGGGMALDGSRMLERKCEQMQNLCKMLKPVQDA